MLRDTIMLEQETEKFVNSKFVNISRQNINQFKNHFKKTSFHVSL